MNEDMSDLPQADSADPDGVQVALRAAHTLWSRGDTTESLKWLRKAAESASDEGADLRSLQLAKAAAELRGKLFGSSEPPPARSASPSGYAAPTGYGAPSGYRAEASYTSASAFRAEGGYGSASQGSAEGAYGEHAAPDAGSASPHASGSVAPDAGADRSAAGAASHSVPPGESGAHPIVSQPSRSESEPPRGTLSSPPLSSPPVDAFTTGASGDDGSTGSSRPITATQYPSHRPRQRMGLLSASPAAQRESSAYSSVPSWSADSERRASAPPPLPQASLDDYEELEAEPDDDAADERGAVTGDDPGSIWSSAGPESWRADESPAGAYAVAQPGASPPTHSPSAPVSAPTPPPLPPRGAFADDDGDFTEQSDPPTVVMPPLEEDGEARSSRRAATSFAVTGNSWDQQTRMPSWEQEMSGSWAAELQHSTWGNGASADSAAPEQAPQSETARAKLTARVHHQAVRVSFAPDLRVPGQYVVRPLREGEKAASGERIALLVALEPGMPLV